MNNQNSNTIGDNLPKVRCLTVHEKVFLIQPIILFFYDILKGLVSGIFRGQSGPTSYRQYLIGTIVRSLTSRFNSLQLQYLGETFEQAYLKFCKARNLCPDFVAHTSGLTGFWIGPKNAKYIIINFHGGGFATDGTSQHLTFWAHIQNELLAIGIETAWFYPTYTLTPHSTYPTQFTQAVQALRYVLEDLARLPEEIILAGDSAGGNLCLAVLSHLMHSSDDISNLMVQSPLKGMILMSPWTSFKTTWPSMSRNLYKDIDSLDTLRKWSFDYSGGKPSDHYMEAVQAPCTWWINAPVERTIVVAGEDEVFLDPITAWDANNDVTYVIANDECHIAPLIWPMFGDFHETHQGRAIKNWLIESLRSEM